MAADQDWFIMIFEQVLGPLSHSDLLAMARGGQLLPLDRVRQGENGRWAEARTVRGLFDQPSPTLGE